MKIRHTLYGFCIALMLPLAMVVVLSLVEWGSSAILGTPLHPPTPVEAAPAQTQKPVSELLSSGSASAEFQLTSSGASVLNSNLLRAGTGAVPSIAWSVRPAWWGRGSNYLSISNRPYVLLGVGTFVVRVTDAEWQVITNHYPTNLQTTPIQFYEVKP